MAKQVINLNGPEGNAFVLMGYGRSLCRQLKRDWEPIQTEMMSGDYENLVKVFKREFCDYFRLVKK
jgi:hypothetical protein